MSRSPVSAPQTLLRHLAAVVSEAAGTGRSDEAEALPLDRQLELLVPALVGTPVLFCVDDAQLLSPTDGLAALSYLSAHGGVRVLLASRERLPMADAGMLRLPGLAKDQAVELATRLDPRMPRHLAERLAARTGGNPMLLRLALGQALQPGCDRERLVDRLESDPEVGEDLLDAALDGLSGTATDLVSLLAVFRQPVDLHDETLARHLLAWRPGLDLHQAVAELRARHLLDHPSSAALHPFIRDRLYLRMVHDLRNGDGCTRSRPRTPSAATIRSRRPGTSASAEIRARRPTCSSRMCVRSWAAARTYRPPTWPNRCSTRHSTVNRTTPRRPYGSTASCCAGCTCCGGI